MQLKLNVTMSLPGWTIIRTVCIAALIAIASLLGACGVLSGSESSAGRGDLFVNDLFVNDLAGQPRSSPATMGALEAIDL